MKDFGFLFVELPEWQQKIADLHPLKTKFGVWASVQTDFLKSISDESFSNWMMENFSTADDVLKVEIPLLTEEEIWTGGSNPVEARNPFTKKFNRIWEASL